MDPHVTAGRLLQAIRDDRADEPEVSDDLEELVSWLGQGGALPNCAEELASLVGRNLHNLEEFDPIWHRLLRLVLS